MTVPRAPLRRLLPAVLAAFAALSGVQPARAAAVAQDEAVLGAALAALQVLHVEPQRPPERLAAGLRGLVRAEPRLSVTLSREGLELAIGSGFRSMLPAPPESDPAAWGRTGAAAIAASAAASPRLRELAPIRRRGLVLEEMASGLDPYTRFVPAADAAARRTALMGIGDAGLTLRPDRAGAVVTGIVPEGPAWRAGLLLGDRVSAIDGIPTRGLDADALADALSGEAATSLSLSVSRRGEPPRSVLVVRAAVVPETARLDWADGIPVITVSAFGRDTEQVVARLVAGLAARKPQPSGLVLDLRGNRGGILQQAVGVADVFLASGEVMHVRGRHPDASRTYLAGGADLAEGMEIVVLVDGRTASAAEALAAALHDLGRARLVGAATQGKGLIQIVHPLPDGAELHISWARLLSPAGVALQENGVMPDLCTSRGAALARTQAAALLDSPATPPVDAWREAASAAAVRTGCPPATGGALDMEAALWLLRRSIAAAPATPEGAPPR
ncbi:MAG: S41 family peptidase [Acetobacteraceae bacterium]|nr:S41 family peptidase [Acetobacteraceae bacterium]